MEHSWITVKERNDTTALYLFESRPFHARRGDKLTLSASADMRYRLLLNGSLLSEGPCQGGEEDTYYETVDATAALCEGENRLRAEVLHTSADQFIAVYRRSETPALWIHGELLHADGTKESLGTNTDDWQAVRIDSRTFHMCPGQFCSVPPFEHQDVEEAHTPLTVCELCPAMFAEDGINPYGLEAHYHLLPRPIPLLREEAPEEMSIGRSYQEGDRYVTEWDAGRYTTAKVHYALCGTAGGQVTMTYAESYSAARPGPISPYNRQKLDRTDTSLDCYGNLYDSITLSGSEQTFSPFWYRAFRYIRVVSDVPLSHFTVTVGRYVFPFTERAEAGGVGKFFCSDRNRNEMWHVSLNTMACSTHELYTDCPYYEQQQYDQDSGEEALFTYRMTNDYSMPKKLLSVMAQSQRKDGLIQANYPSRFVQIIPSFSLFYVMMSREYLRYTGDRETVRRLIGVCDGAMEAFRAATREDGIVDVIRGWNFLDWVPGWKNGVPPGGNEHPLTAYNLLYATALGMQAEVCDAVGRPGLAADYRARRDTIIAAVNRMAFDPERGMYNDTVGGEKHYSQHTAIWAVLSGAVKGTAAADLMRHAMEDPDVDHATFSVNYYTFRALEVAGVYDLYADRVFAGWQKMLDEHCTTWCENPDDPRSECHGWSSAPIYEFSAMTLGVYPLSDGYERVRIAPHTASLTEAHGRVPIPGGYIDVAWKKIRDNFVLDIRASRPLAMEIRLPGGRTDTVTADAYNCTISAI